MESKDTQTKTISLPEEASNELKAILEQAKETAEKKDEARVEYKKEATFDETAPSVDTKMFSNPSNPLLNKTIQETTVTEKEKEIFLESVLHDTPFTLDIEVLDGKAITISSRTTYEQSLCFECVGDMMDNKDNKAKDILLCLQRYTVALAVKKVLGQDFSSLSFDTTGGDTQVKDAHKKELNDFVNEHLVDMKYPRWQMIATAFMVFTIKEKLLLENVANRDFWNPVG